MKQRSKALSRLTLAGLACAALGLFLVDRGRAEQSTEPDSKASVEDNQYIGAKKCKSCHSKEEVGDQYGHWEKSKHAHAFEVLASPEALAAGKERGVTEPQKDEKCLKCHTTAFGVPEEQIAKGFKADMGVQCETCHGPGENHMKARFAAAAKGADAAKEVPPGEILDGATEATCRGCHNSESPTFKSFCYHKFKEMNRHLRPGRSDEELGQLLVCGCGDVCSCVDECADGCAVPASSKK